MPSKKFDAIWEAARAEKAIDVEALMLLSEAIEDRRVNSALQILARAADYLGEGKPMPRLIELYLAYSLQSIALGQEPAQALHLKQNAKAKIGHDELMRLFYAVEWHRRNGARSEKDAIRRAASQLGLKVPAAEKRFATANAEVGPTFRALTSTMRSLSVRVPTLGYALAGTSATQSADDVIESIIDLLGSPNQGG